MKKTMNLKKEGAATEAAIEATEATEVDDKEEKEVAIGAEVNVDVVEEEVIIIKNKMLKVSLK